MADELGRVQLEVAVDLATLQTQLQQVRTEVEKLPDISLGLKVDTQGVTNQLNTITRQFQKRADFKVGVTYTSLTNAALAAQQLKADLDALNARKDNVSIELNLDTLNRQVSNVDALLEDLRDARPIQLRIDTGLIDDAAAGVDRLLEQLRETRPILLRADTGNVEEVVQSAAKTLAELRSLPPVLLRFDPSAVSAAVDAVNDAINTLRQQAPIPIRFDTKQVSGAAAAVEDALDVLRRQEAIPLKFDLGPLRAAIAAVDDTIDTLKKQEAIRLPVDLLLEPARAELAAFRKEASVPVPVRLELQAGTAKQEADALSKTLTSTAAQLPIDLLVDGARADLSQLRTEVSRPASVPLTADAAKANSVLAAFRKAAASALQIPLSAVTAQAEKAVQALRGKLSDPLPLQVAADTSDATTKLEALQAQLNELVGQTYKVQVQVEQTGLSPEELQRRVREAMAGGLSENLIRGTSNIGGIEQAAATAAQASILRDELLQRINAPRRTGEQDFGNRGLRQFLEATGGVPEGITSKSVRADLQAASRERLQGLPDQQLLDLAQTLRDINAKLGPIGGAGGAGAGGGPQRGFLDQIARMMLMMAGLDAATIQQQVQQQRALPSGIPDPWNYTGGPLPFRPAQRPEGTPLLTGVNPVERTLLRDPALRDPRRLLGPDGGLDQPRRFAERLRANEQRNAARFQEQRLASDLANNAARSQRLLPSGLDRDLQDILRNAANAFVDQLRRQLNAAIRQVQVQDLGPTTPAELGGFAGPAGLLPDSTAAGRAAAQFRADRTQAARARSAAREQFLREVPLLPPAIGNFDTRRREDTVRRAQELVDRGQLQPRRGETPVQTLQREETRRGAAQFRLEQRRFRDSQQAAAARVREERRIDAVIERERQAEQRRVEARQAAGARRRGDAVSNAIIGGAFPALFGQGLGASAGGAIGGAAGSLLLPGAGGFAGSLIGTALGAQVDASVGKLDTLAKALGDPIEQFSALQEAALLSSRAVEKNVQALIKAGEAEEAAARIRQDLIERFGTENPLGGAPDELSRKLAEVGVAMAQLAAGPLAELAEGIRKFIVITGFVFGDRRPTRATPGQQEQAQTALDQAQARSRRLFSTRFEQAARGGSPDTARNRERAIRLQLDQLQLQYEQAFRAARPEDRLGLSRQNTLQEQELRSSLRREQRQNRLALEDATIAGGRQIEDAQRSLATAQQLDGLVKLKDQGARAVIESRARIDELLTNRQRAFEDVERLRANNADQSQIVAAEDRFKVAGLEASTGVLRERDTLGQLRENLNEEVRGLFEAQTQGNRAFRDAAKAARRSEEDLSTGLTSARGSAEGVNKYIDPAIRAQRQFAAGQNLDAEVRAVSEQLGVGTPTFRGTLAEQNAQKAEFISAGRSEQRAGEDMGEATAKLAEQTEGLVKINEQLAAKLESLSAVNEALTKSTATLANKDWRVVVNVDSGAVSGDAFRSLQAATSP